MVTSGGEPDHATVMVPLGVLALALVTALGGERTSVKYCS
jgi:hypothetical protein